MKSLRSLMNRSPVPLDSVSRLNFLQPTPGNLSRQLRMMEESGTVYQIVHRLSESTSQSDWALYRKRGPRMDPNTPRQPVQVHAALNLWNAPNPFYSTQMLMETACQHLELTGESFWVVSYFAGTTLPSELWPVRPDRMIPVSGGKDFLSGWVYLSPDGERIPLQNNEVVQVKFPHPRDPFRGLSPIIAILGTVDSLALAQQWNLNFFRNSAEPRGIVEVPETLDDRAFNRLRDQFRENHQGVQAAHRVGILEQGMKWVDTSTVQKDMQFVEMLNTGREIIREAYGMSKTMLGLTEDVNRATADAAQIVFARYQLEGRLNRYKGVLNSVLLPMFGETGKSVEFDYECLVPEDEAAENEELKAKTESFATLVSKGVHPDDAAAICGLPPMRVQNMSTSTEGGTNGP